MGTIHINLPEAAIFFSIFLRLSIILFMLPIFKSVNIASHVKVLTVFALALMLFPFIQHNVQPLPVDPGSLVMIIVGEVVFGIVFSLSMVLVLAAFEMAGELVSFEMGFGFAQVADPQTGVESSLLSVWAQLLALMVFFAMNWHLVLLRLIVESYTTIPMGAFSVDAALFEKILTLSGLLFVMALKISAPIVAVLMLIQLGLGLMSKFAPQINILTTSFPITISLGILFMGITTLMWGDMARRYFTDFFHFVSNLPK